MMQLPPRPAPPIRVAISQCLVGDEVRYDGTGAKSSMPHERLAGLFAYTAICPEVGIGMPVPRAPIRLVDRGERGVRVEGVTDTGVDKTDELRDFARSQVPGLAGVAGYVFMHNSPSCGLFRVKLYPQGDGMPRRRGRGAYADELTQRLPALPVEEAGRLFDDVLRENFVTRAFAYAHWLAIREVLTPALLIAFHSAYKYLLMAHSIAAYREAGVLLSNLKRDFTSVPQRYIQLLMAGLTVPATPGGHANVLAHLQGYLKQRLDSSSRQELSELIDAYRRGEQPLLAPIALLKHHFKRFPDEYVLKQSYLDPHPSPAALRRRL